MSATAPLWLEPEQIWAYRRRIRVEEDEARNLTASEARVATALASLAAEGNDAPTEAQIAARARRSRRTVARAKVRLAELGLLVWERRGELVRGAWRRISCLYRLVVPATPAATVLRCCKCQIGATRKEGRKQEARGVEREATSLGNLPDLSLPTIDRAAALAAAWWARRSGWLRSRWESG